MKFVHRLLPNQLSFKQQLIIAFSFGIICFSVVSTLVISSISSHTVHKQFVLQGKKITETFAEQSKLALLYQSTENARDASKSILSFPDVSNVAIYDKNHTSLFHGGDKKSGRNITSWPLNGLEYVELEDTWHFSMPVYSGEWEQEESSPFSAQTPVSEHIGFVQVNISKDSLHVMNREILQSNLLIVLGSSIVLLLLLLILTNRLLRPLKQLAVNMRQAEQGNIRVRAKLEGSVDLLLMEQAFNTMMNELESRENELVVARDKAIDMAKAKGEFAATVSHELRTPMNGVLGMLQLLQSAELDTQAKEYVGIATSSAQTLLLLIDDILDFSKIESGKMKFHIEDFGIRELVTDVVELLALQSNAKQVMLSAVIDPSIKHSIKGDSGRLRQILLNLVGNAIKFTDQGMVMVRVEQVSSGEKIELKFEVEDTGIGISKEAQKRIFDSFVQADGSTTRTYGGTGLGLTISEQLINLMGGVLGVRSEVNKGSTFYFTLPMGISVQSKLFEKPVNQALSPLSPLRILTVGTNNVRNKVFSIVLTSWHSLHQHAETCEQAAFMMEKSFARRLPYDLVIIDNPIMSTFKLESFGSANEIEHVKFLVLSDDLSQDSVLASHTAAMDTYHCKYLSSVVDSATLRREIQRLLGEDKVLQSKESETTDLKHRESTRILVVDDNPTNQIVAKSMLERLGYWVELVENGQGAIEKIAESSFDMILMDCLMPVMDGYEATKLIRADEASGDKIPILAMTAHTYQSDRQRCFSAGMNDYVEKPLKFEDLEEKMALWLTAPVQKEISLASKQELLQNRDVSEAMSVEGRAEVDVDRQQILQQTKVFPIDTDKMHEMRTRMGEVYSKILIVFMEDTPSLIESLEYDLAHKDTCAINHGIHCLKGAALNINAAPLANLCIDLEAVVASGNLAQANILLLEIVNEYKEVKAALQDELFTNKVSLHSPVDVSQKIMVVDDDRSARFALQGILERDGFAMIEACDGLDAVQKCQESMPDMILMDAMMPGIDGFEACQQILNLSSTARPIIIMVTALHDEDSIEKAFAAGATDFIPKPINFMLLRKRVNRLLQSSQTERKVYQLAYYDALTNLPNRELFLERGRELIQRAYTANHLLALLYIDLDRFTLVNETQGHEVGDLLLKTVAQRIQGCIRSGDVLARICGDEFAIILDRVHSPDVVIGVAEKIRMMISRPFSFMKMQVFSHASIGIAIYPNNGNNIGSMLKHADTALFRAKAKGGNCFQYYEQGMETEAIRKIEMEQELKLALENGELVLYYQPQFDFKLGKTRGVEALIRWEHPERGLIPPMEFIPLAEECGLINEIGDWVLLEACSQQVRWIALGISEFSVSVNVASEQLESGELFSKVSQVIESTKIKPSNLILEITENTLLGTSEAIIEQMEQIRQLGVILEIDDFGTGYSSLSYLKRFPIDTLKIDRAFIKDLPGDQDDISIVQGIVGLAHNLGLSVVAEGVETDEQKSLLQTLNCDVIQGYLLSQPLPVKELENWLKGSVYAGLA